MFIFTSHSAAHGSVWADVPTHRAAGDVLPAQQRLVVDAACREVHNSNRPTSETDRSQETIAACVPSGSGGKAALSLCTSIAYALWKEGGTSDSLWGACMYAVRDGLLVRHTMEPADSPALKNFFLVLECTGISRSCSSQARAFTVPATRPTTLGRGEERGGGRGEESTVKALTDRLWKCPWWRRSPFLACCGRQQSAKDGGHQQQNEQFAVISQPCIHTYMGSQRKMFPTADGKSKSKSQSQAEPRGEGEGEEERESPRFL